MTRRLQPPRPLYPSPPTSFTIHELPSLSPASERARGRRIARCGQALERGSLARACRPAQQQQRQPVAGRAPPLWSAAASRRVVRGLDEREASGWQRAPLSAAASRGQGGSAGEVSEGRQGDTYSGQVKQPVIHRPHALETFQRIDRRRRAWILDKSTRRQPSRDWAQAESHRKGIRAPDR